MHRWIARLRLALGLLTAVLAIEAGPLARDADAQYFGRNKVQYKTFRFEILKTDHFDLYYYAEERAAAEQAGRMAERWYTRLSKLLKHELSGRQPLILYASHPDFEQTNVIQGDLDESTGGVTEFMKRRIVLPMAGTLQETDHVIGHELVHAFQYDITRQANSESGSSAPAVARLPLWFIEGMAEYLSIGPEDPNTAMWIRDAAEVNRLPGVVKLADPRFFPYRYGQALWAYIGARWGDEVIGEALKAAGKASDPEQAMRRVLGVGPDTLSREWHESIRSWYSATAAVTQPTERFAKVLVKGEPDQARLNVSPSLSPDGNYLMFLSERSLFAIELFLADARTGKVIRSITRAAVDPHYQSLQFIQSSGAWSPDGRRFAFGAVSSGRPVLTVIDVQRNRTVRELKFPELGEVFSPSWSPDGKQIVFSAQTGGVTDLHIVEVDNGRSRRLTDDLFADLHPTWSPDGSTIAFVTDRFTTKVEELSFGHERLAALDVATGDIRELGGRDDGKNINPQWSPDGQSLFFISDSKGISNIHRMDVASRTITQVTNVRTGVSGISRLSPSLSVARRAERAAFSVYQDGSYSIFVAESPAVLAGRPDSDSVMVATVKADELPPPDGRPSTVVEMVGKPDLGLVAQTGFERKPYRARLSLDLISQTSVGIGAGTYGLAVSGGTTLYWSDILGNHNLATMLQVSNEGGNLLNNVASIVSYDNRKSRVNWGVDAGQIPYLTRAFEIEDVVVDGQPVVIQRDHRFWEVQRLIQGSIAYPINRLRRVELGGGYRHVGFESEVETRAYSAVTGELLEQATFTQDSLNALNLFDGLAALIHDSSVFGGTSPVMGQRFRLELSPVAGDLQYLGALADLRSYLMPIRPVTLAARLIHFGRYGRDGEDPRLSEIFIGSGWLIRGYDSGSFTVGECGISGDCPAYDRLFGSRAGIANLELRFPLLGALGLLRTPALPPIEAAGFYDVGVAWTTQDKATFLGGRRDPVSSYGGLVRVNLLGFAIAEFAMVHPVDRPLKNWYWQFGLQPGF